MSEKGPTVADRHENEYYAGCLYDKQDFWRFQLAKAYLSRVSIADEEVKALKELAGEVLSFTQSSREVNSTA